MDSASTYIDCPLNGSGTSLPEQYVPIRPDGGDTPIYPGQSMLWRSLMTGLYCHVVTAAGQNRNQPRRITPPLTRLAASTTLTWQAPAGWTTAPMSTADLNLSARPPSSLSCCPSLD
jgi:hypothetical protein